MQLRHMHCTLYNNTGNDRHLRWKHKRYSCPLFTSTAHMEFNSFIRTNPNDRSWGFTSSKNLVHRNARTVSHGFTTVCVKKGYVYRTGTTVHVTCTTLSKYRAAITVTTVHEVHVLYSQFELCKHCFSIAKNLCFFTIICTRTCRSYMLLLYMYLHSIFNQDAKYDAPWIWKFV